VPKHLQFTRWKLSASPIRTFAILRFSPVENGYFLPTFNGVCLAFVIYLPHIKFFIAHNEQREDRVPAAMISNVETNLW